ncbi:Emp65 protein [Maudiozyma humilis]|uniref:Emp65 protein n=1 Tax=Maudiozyma humilis TaxID=51915 RepID=A0AAV5RYA9_MAUHU|nr:Emp65 protein [Kazachstania humilis]
MTHKKRSRKVGTEPMAQEPEVKGATADEKRHNGIAEWLRRLDEHPLRATEPLVGQELRERARQEMEQLGNMVRIPLRIEQFMAFTLLASLDCFLYYFTVLPIKIVVGVSWGRHNNALRLSRTYRERVTLLLILCVSIGLSQLDTSKVYHRIKRQSAMKLYMLFSVLEVADKMLASLGQSLLGVLLSKSSYRHLRKRQLLLVGLSLCYLGCHCVVLLYQTIALNVAVNSYSNSLVTLLLSLQFAEIKSAVFKKFDKEGLFQLTLADSAERFKLSLLITIIMLRNLGTTQLPIWPQLPAANSLVSSVLRAPVVYILGSELVVDWVKHAYITKFNRIRPGIYDKFFYIMQRDHATSQQVYLERLGLPVLAYVTVSVLMLHTSMHTVVEQLLGAAMWPGKHLTIGIVLTVSWFSLLLLLRLATHRVLVRWGQHIRTTWPQGDTTTTVTAADYVAGAVVDGVGAMDSRTRTIIHRPAPTPPPDLAQKRDTHNAASPAGLETVTRYTMASKTIW